MSEVIFTEIVRPRIDPRGSKVYICFKQIYICQSICQYVKIRRKLEQAISWERHRYSICHYWYHWLKINQCWYCQSLLKFVRNLYWVTKSLLSFDLRKNPDFYCYIDIRSKKKQPYGQKQWLWRLLDQEYTLEEPKPTFDLWKFHSQKVILSKNTKETGAGDKLRMPS